MPDNAHPWMKGRALRIRAGAIACLLWLACGARADVLVFAAASVGPALSEIAADHTARTGVAVTVSAAGTSALARQIEAGAPADVFVSADAAWMDRLDAAGRIDPATRADLVSNALVLVGPAGAAPLTEMTGAALVAALDGGRLAMALVDAVPAGLYGKAALEWLGAWTALEGRVVQADNVRAALALVALGAAGHGIVYATDARAEPRVAVVAAFPPESHPPIRYPVAAIGKPDAETRAFLRTLQGPKARAVFDNHGFGPPG